MSPATLDLLAKFAGPVATIIASITAAGVTIFFGMSQARNARRQTEIANDRLALDLFEKRFSVYERIREPIGAITRSGAGDHKVEYDLLSAIDAARFLFGQAARKYLDSIYNHLIELNSCNLALGSTNLSFEERAKFAEARTRHFQAITDFYKKVDDVFGPYLSATHRFTDRES